MSSSDSKLMIFSGGPFGNWHRTTFTLLHPEDGKTPVIYSCVEQRLMHCKAIAMGDIQKAKAILATKQPMIQKKLGRQVSNYNDQKWAAIRQGIAFEAIMAKFEQNVDLLKVILAARGNFVEASARDRIWGAGIGPKHVDINHPDRYPGTNLLGKILDRVRDELVAKYTKPAT